MFATKALGLHFSKCNKNFKKYFAKKLFKVLRTHARHHLWHLGSLVYEWKVFDV